MPSAKKTRHIVRDVIALLAEAHPQTFMRYGDCVPLKIGIDKDLIAAHPDIRARDIGLALLFYTNTARYLRSLLRCRHRVDLDGNQCGDVSQPHFNFAVTEAVRREVNLSA
jgi:ProP effector